MCGIVGYVGPQPALDVVVEGLGRLEYRGYDSAGVAVLTDGTLVTEKRAGKLDNLRTALDGKTLTADGIGIGHTRWATHGPPTDRNAHPHVDGDNRVAVVHNGIIENFARLRLELEEQGCKFRSETDTEIAAHLLSLQLRETGGDLAAALRAVCQRLEGTFTLVACSVDDQGLIVAARRNSPLVVGRGEDGNFLASDVAAFIAHTRSAVELGQDQVVELRSDSIRVTDYAGNPAPTRDYHVDWDASAAEKGGYDYFMLKEIVEQPGAVADTLLGRLGVDGTLSLDEMRLSDADLRDIHKIVIIAAGTSYHAGLIAKYAIEHWCRIPCEVEVASEFRYRDPILDAQTLVIAISQSGESLDTMMALRYAREQRSKVLAICNVNGSSIPRESDGVVYTHAGPEVGVAATKTFLTQLVACYLVGMYLAQVRGFKFGDEIQAIIDQLANMPSAVESVLNTIEPVRQLARSLAEAHCVLFLGRHVGYPVALEGALKLKELAYMHAEAFSAGELKHGPIALIEEGLPVVVVMPSREGRGVLHDKLVSNIQEIRARGARTIVIAEQGDETVRPYADELIEIPAVPTLLQPIVATVPLQVFACELALAKGNDVDQPRNLAKSVTVE